MTTHSLPSRRLTLKRAFTAYFLNLASPGIADPTEAFAASYDYLSVLLGQLGAVEFMRRIDDETTHLVGEVDQDLRRRSRDREPLPDLDDLEDRLRECFEYALGQLHTSLISPR